MTIEIYKWLRQFKSHEELMSLEIMRDPDLWRELKDLGVYEQDLAEYLSDPLTGTDFGILTARYIFRQLGSNFNWAARTALRKAGPSAFLPVLRRIAEDATLCGRLVAGTNPVTVFRDEDPFARFCALLDGTDSPPVALRFVNHENREVVKRALTATCSTGTLEMIPCLIKVLEEADEDLCTWALVGLERSIKANRLHPAAAVQLYPDLLRWVQTGKEGWCSVGILVKLNPRRAMADLRSDRILNADFPQLAAVLRYFVKPEDLPARDILEYLFEDLSRKERRWPVPQTLGRLLRVIGRHRKEEDEERLKAFMEEEDRDLAQGAAKGLMALHGLENARQIALAEREPGGGRSAWTWYAGLYHMQNTVQNRGWAEYFVDPHSDRWIDARRALEEAGSVEWLDILDEALALFPDGSPLPDHDLRERQVAKILEQDEKAFITVDEKFEASREHLHVLLARLVLKHRDDFGE